MESTKNRLDSAERLKALAETDLLDALPSESLDRLTRVVEAALGVPMALVSLVDDHRQFFTSAVGLPDDLAATRQTPLSHSFCQHVVIDEQKLIVEDASTDARVAGNLAIPDLNVQAYAGYPIRTEEGLILGSFCAIDHRPRKWTDSELSILRDLAATVSAEIELLRRAHRAEASERATADIHASLLEEKQASTADIRVTLHDVRTPLSVLALGVSHLSTHVVVKAHPELEKMLAMLRRNVDYASSLVSSIAAEGRTTTDVGVAVREICGDVALSADGRLRCTQLPEGRTSVNIEVTEFRRSVENLVSNALRFARDEVRVSVRQVDAAVGIVVEDDGPGLPTPEAYARVWDTHVRYHLHEGRSGTGLGLSIVRRTIERAGGSVSARPSSLGGAAFEFRLPLAR